MNHRLVVVSNRVPKPRAEGTPPGGLVSALLPSLEATGSAVWFGWSGDTTDDDYAAAAPRRVFARGVEYATVDLTAEQVRAYYEEYGNRVLWPVMHGMVDRMAPEAASEYPTYREVNAHFARLLRPLLRAEDLVWVHDYHLIPLAQELRRLGWQGRTGYFHHTPIPTPDTWAALPQAGALAASFEAYDLIGVQTERDRRNLASILGDRDVGSRVRAYPISIDPDHFREFTEQSRSATAEPPLGSDDAMLFFGVERLDYTKAIPQRLDAFAMALEASPEMRRRARFVQWAAPSRTGVPEYQDEREAIEAAAEALNARFGGRPLEIDFEAHPPEVVAPALAQADVCVVSSVADGMNLVAKEFAAVHSEEQPGVLVLSDMCGAAEELTEALIYPAGDLEAMSEALRRAFFMPESERRRRAARLRAIVDRHTSTDWLRGFVDDLARTAARPRVRAILPGHPRTRDGRDRPVTPVA